MVQKIGPFMSSSCCWFGWFQAYLNSVWLGTCSSVLYLDKKVGLWDFSLASKLGMGTLETGQSSQDILLSMKSFVLQMS